MGEEQRKILPPSWQKLPDGRWATPAVNRGIPIGSGPAGAVWVGNPPIRQRKWMLPLTAQGHGPHTEKMACIVLSLRSTMIPRPFIRSHLQKRSIDVKENFSC